MVFWCSLDSGEKVTALLTLALVVTTMVYAYFTWSMANIMKKTLFLDRRPYLAFENLNFEIFQDPITSLFNIQIGLILKNAGKVLLKYEVVNIEIVIPPIQHQTLNMLNKGGHIFPGFTNIFRYSLFKGLDSSKMPWNGTVNFEIRYWSDTREEEYSTKRKLTFSLLSFNPFHAAYTFLEEEEK